MGAASRCYYNEHDPKAAAWLRELIKGGHIAPGVVDERSICDVQPEDIRDFVQCHFFAGIGGWSLALRLAGWPDDEPVWTMSCPCQPFSGAGKQLGRKDPGHLWPQGRRLINRARPAIVLGEQVASADGRAWLAGVFANLETMGYAPAGADLCSAGIGEECEVGVARGDTVSWERGIVGSPNIRQRLYWVAHTQDAERRGKLKSGESPSNRGGGFTGNRVACGLADVQQPGLEGHGGHEHDGDQSGRQPAQPGGPVAPGGAVGRVANAPSLSGAELRGESGEGSRREPPTKYASECGGTGGLGDAAGGGCGVFGDASRPGSGGHVERPGWSRFDVIPCRDGKARRVESGTFPLAHGIPARVVRLRGYGNAINPVLAAEFISAAVAAIAEIRTGGEPPKTLNRF